MVDVPVAVWGWARGGAGDLAPVIVALAWAETGGSFDPEAVGDAGCSKGWLQFNQCGGLGQGHPDAELFDPVASAALAAGYLRGRLARNGGDLRDAMAPWSTRDAALAVLPQLGVDVGSVAPAPAGGGGALVVGLVLVGVALWLVLG